MTFSTQYRSGRPTTAEFYYNGRAIGTGREAFSSIVDRISKLAPGASIVWGPNYDRCGSCSGDEPGCVPKFLYPGLWKRLERHAENRRFTLSSKFPGPCPMPIGSDGDHNFPKVLDYDDVETSQFDAVLDWELANITLNRHDDADPFLRDKSYSHRFVAAAAALNEFDLDLFFGRLPENARLLVRLVLPKKPASLSEREWSALADSVLATWRRRISEPVRLGRLQPMLGAPPPLAAALRTASRSRIAIDWSNFHGPQTPHEEVLYFIDDQYAGRGDEGFGNILANVRQLPAGGRVILPRYEYGGRSAMETLLPEEIAAKNAELRNLVPFARRRAEFDAELARRRLRLEYAAKGLIVTDPRTVLDWQSGDRYCRAFVSFGRILRHDEARRPAAARLGWTRYEDGKRGPGGRNPVRQLETDAFYTLNDVEMGQAAPGFANAMREIAALPDGAVVQVRVCLRTKAPFRCALIYQHQRHFERTGFEPYFGLFPWIIDVARNNKLELEWVPDEQESCRDCELNR